MRAILLPVLLLLASSAVRAAEPNGCDAFKFPIERARAALTATDRVALTSGASLAALPAKAATMALRTPDAAALPMPPERAPKAGTFAGYASFDLSPPAGTYTIGLSDGVWVDVVQGGRILKPTAFSGATGCDGIRKALKYELNAVPFVIQISSAPADAVAFTIAPAE